MVDDVELQRVRELYSELILRPGATYDIGTEGPWFNFLHTRHLQQCRAIIVSKQVPQVVRGGALSLFAEIGMLVADDVLMGAPVPIDEVGDRRWQLRRELEMLVDRMDLEDLQRSVWHAHALVGPGERT